MSKILLVNTTKENDKEASSSIYPPLGLLSIAGKLKRDGYDVRLIDPQVEEDFLELLKEEIEQKPLFVGMTTFMGKNILNAVDLSKLIKELSPETPIVWGGPLATGSPELCLNHESKCVDYIVMGIGEITVSKLVKALENNEDVSLIDHVSSNINGNMLIKEKYFLEGDIDSLGDPDLKLWENGVRKMNTIPILSSRGCPRNCSYCYNNAFTGRKKWFACSGEKIVADMERWNRYFNIDNFYFIDDNFLVDTQRAVYILKKAIEKKFKISQITGHLIDFKPDILKLVYDYIRQAGFSIESASERIQKLLNKKINLNKALELLTHLSDNKIETINTNFMFGFPSETTEDIAKNIEMALKIRNINPKIRCIPFIYTPQPQDDIVPQFESCRNLLFTLENLSHFDLAPHRTNFLSNEIRPWMSKEEIYFYINLIKIWFFHFDYKTRESMEIDYQDILRNNEKLRKLFENIPILSLK
ncbi:MAG: radical SAM protein [Pseudomonadota bacterium]